MVTVNKERMTEEFMNLVRIDSLSRQERQMADKLKSILEGLGLIVYEDEAGKAIGGNAGNLICTYKGDASIPAVALMAHMDTVVPGIGKKPVLKDGIICSDGTTVLGGDDLAGVEIILETIRLFKENNIPHGDIQIIFTISEEGGLFGSANLDYSKVHAKYAFIMDSDGDIGSVAVQAPSQNNINVEIRGKAAHAGMEPEKGISAIQITARAIDRMKLGRISI